MRILIDGDGCPVVDITIGIAKSSGIQCIILCDTAHFFDREGATTITVSKGADSVDFALVNMLQPKDIVVTQDYGLAAMCLARGAIPISQNGMVYHENNIDALLMQRHMAKKIRRSGGRLSGPSKRTEEENTVFASKLKELVTGKAI